MPTTSAVSGRLNPPPFRSFVEALPLYSERVDAALEAALSDPEPVANLHDAAAYSLGLDIEDRAARGKRLRPALCLATAEALGASMESAMPFAVGIELLHNFALVHDDIQDGDTMRRGRPCVWRQYGLAHGVNVGDFLQARMMRTVLRSPSWDAPTRLRLLDLLDDTLEHTLIGQALDINARASKVFTLADYLRLVREKTGFYLAAPMLGGAMIAGAPEEVLDMLRRFGQAIGPLFQIVDDMIDLTEAKGRGEPGSDIREGKRSYLVAAVTEVCPPADRERLYEILDLPREETTADHVAWVLALYRRHGALDRGAAYCDQLRREGLDAIAHAPDALRSTLTNAAELLLTRKT